MVPPVYEVALRCQTVAGSGRIGATDGAAEVSTFSFPTHVLPLADGSALVSDTGNDSVRHVSIDGRGGYSVRKVSLQGFTWMRPRGMAQLPDGGVLVCDSGHNRIRLLGADGGVSVYAGSGRRGRGHGHGRGRERERRWCEVGSPRRRTGHPRLPRWRSSRLQGL